ncbi:aldose 1-epimerase family protein [Serinibacter arcticus]|uniref:aldose 1-epimerase family protein n=1 Tax=Serinibacter arcticus TaxID=1655435 RepID=UPI001304812F|nr:aldose 1-epimerase family protein [Serinibacter arcticus]
MHAHTPRARSLGWPHADPPTGSQHVLHDPASSATVVLTEVGASLRSFDVAGRDVVVSYPEDELSPAGHGAILAPWPNRLADGAYSFDGTDYQLPVTEVARSTALHGLVLNQRWAVRSLTTTQARLVLETVPVAGYPWQLGLEAHYELRGTSLTIEVSATNRSATVAPYGIGFHPWLSPGDGGLDAATLRLDATQWVRPDERLLPAGVEELPQAFDFRTERLVGSTDLDDAFVGATRDADGLSWIRLTGADGRTAGVWMDESMDTWQVCSGDHIGAVDYRRRGLAAEPMSCIADAFNSGDRLVRLEPGATHTVRWGLTLS